MPLTSILVSSLKKGSLRAIVIEQARHPDYDSEFDIRTRDIRDLPDEEFFSALMERQYDGLLFFKKDSLGIETFIGAIFWQEVNSLTHNVWHAFRLEVLPKFRGQGYSHQLVSSFLQAAHDRSVKTIHIGAGGSPAVIHIFRKIVRGEITLPFPMELDENQYTITFSDIPVRNILFTRIT